MGYNPNGFWHQVHASHLYQGSGPRRFSGRVHWIPNRRRGGEVRHGWKINWHGLLAGAFILKGICWWHNKSKGFQTGVGSNISWEGHYWEILKTGLLGHKQRGWVWCFISRDGHGSKNGWKDSGDIFGFKIGHRLDEGGVKGQGRENAIIFESS